MYDLQGAHTCASAVSVASSTQWKINPQIASFIVCVAGVQARLGADEWETRCTNLCEHCCPEVALFLDRWEKLMITKQLSKIREADDHKISEHWN